MRSSGVKALLLAMFCAIGCLLAAGSAYGTAGHLDRSFGGDGMVTIPTITGDAHGVTTDGRDRVVAVGVCPQPGCIVRYTRRGRRDRSFSRDGKVLNNEFRAQAVAMDSGRIVVAGQMLQGRRTAFVVARYRSDGHLDRSFSRDGMAVADMGGSSEAVHSAAVDSKGRIVVGGFAFDRQRGGLLAVARYLPNGSLDTSFGGDGTVTKSFPDFASLGAIAVDAENRIVATGAGGGTTQGFGVVRLRGSGRVDRSFGTDGQVTTRFRGSGDAVGQSVTIDRRDRIIVAGNAGDDFGLARYRASGRLNRTFGAGGRVTTDFGDRIARLSAVAIGPGGRIVAAGRHDGRFALARYRRSGILDRSFSDDGLVARPGGGANALDVDSKGRPVAAGFHDDRFAVVRYRGS